MGDDDLVGVGLDLEPQTLLAAYRAGLFPMHVNGRRGPLGWWSPDPRGIIPLEGVRISRSLRASCRRYVVTVDEAFDAVVDGCADPARSGAWIGRDIRRAYSRLHDEGVAHSVEVRDPAGGGLVGGLYGVSIGGLFAGESMFHRATDASKVALVGLVRLLTTDGVTGRLLDTQWTTPHLRSLGAVDVNRTEYLELLRCALELPPPPAFAVSGRAGP